MNVAWAYSVNTIQYIDGELYGTTVLGGNLLKVEKNGTVKILWENDYANQLEGGVFLYSVLYDDKLYFFPYMTEQIVVYDIRTNVIEKIQFKDKEVGEKTFAHVYNNAIFIFGLNTGRVWKLQGSEIESITGGYKSCGELSKTRRAFERNNVFFCDTNESVVIIYDCLNNSWRRVSFPYGVEDGLICDNDIWLIEKGNLHCFSENSNKDEVIISGSADEYYSYIIQADENRLLCFESKGIIYEVDMRAHSIKNIKENDFLRNSLQWGLELGGGMALLIDITNLDWMLRENDKYLLFDLNSMKYIQIPMFAMDQLTKELVYERYSRIAWALSQDLIIPENQNEKLSFLIETLHIGVFEA